MPERRVATVEFTESEAMGLIWLARCGEIPIRGYGLQAPDGTNLLHASDALKKLVRALAIEQGSGGHFDRPRPEERMIDAVRQPPEWARPNG